jgi:two-component system chemotaxis response regulator CheY
MMKMLVADNSRTMRKILINKLYDAGVTDVVEASDGQQTVNLIMQDDTIDLVLMDWNMPGMLGIDVLKAIRAAGKTVPLIIVTANADKDSVIEAFNAGATSLILRPFKTETIISKIQEIVTQNGAHGNTISSNKNSISP